MRGFVRVFLQEPLHHSHGSWFPSPKWEVRQLSGNLFASSPVQSKNNGIKKTPYRRRSLTEFRRYCAFPRVEENANVMSIGGVWFTVHVREFYLSVSIIVFRYVIVLNIFSIFFTKPSSISISLDKNPSYPSLVITEFLLILFPD